MKRILLTLIVSGLLLTGVGCSATNNQVEQVATEEERVTSNLITNEVMRENRVVLMQFTVPESANGETLMDTLKAHTDVLEDDGMIKEINDMIAVEANKEFISIMINGEFSMKGAEELVLRTGDTVRLEIDTWE